MIKSRTKNRGIIEAIKELKEISLIDILRYDYEMRLKAKRDHVYSDEEIITEFMTEYKMDHEEALKKVERKKVE